MGYIRFKIKPNKHTNFFWAYLFDTKKEMRDWYGGYVKKQGIEVADDSQQFSAIVMPFQIFKGGDEMQSNIGICLFHRKALGVGLISHEMLHCALWFDRAVNGNISAQYGECVGEEEERLAYLLTDLVRKFVKKMYKIGVY